MCIDFAKRSFLISFLIFLSFSGCKKTEKDPREIFAAKLHTGSVTAVAFSPDGGKLASASLDRTVRFLDVKGYKGTGGDDGYSNGFPPEIYQISPIMGVGRGFTAIDFSPDGTLFATGEYHYITGGMVQVYDLSTGEMVARWKAADASIRSIDFHPFSRSIAVAAGDDERFGGTSIIDPTTETVSPLVEKRFGGAHRATYSADGALLVSAGLYDQTRIFDVATQTELFHLEYPLHHAVCAVFSPDGIELATSGYDDPSITNSSVGAIHFWEVATGALNRSVIVSDLPIRALAVSPSGDFVAAAGEDLLIHVINSHSLVEVATLQGHLAPINTIAFSPNAEILASGSDDYYLRLWFVGDLPNEWDDDTASITDSTSVDGGLENVDGGDAGSEDTDGGGEIDFVTDSDTVKDTGTGDDSETSVAAGTDSNIGYADGGIDTAAGDSGEDTSKELIDAEGDAGIDAKFL